MAEEKFSLLDIVVIACFISLVFSPVGIVLMWIKSKWSKKVKLIVSGVFVLVCALVVMLIVFLNNSPETGGGGGNTYIGMNQNADGGGGGSSSSDYKPSSKSNSSKMQSGRQSTSQTASNSFMQQVTKSRWFYFFLLVLIMGVIVVIKNLKGGNVKNDSNPYVNIDLYKIPIPDGFVFPEIKFSKLSLQSGEKILFATPAEQKDNSGDIAITTRRFVFLGRKENYDFPINSISRIYSLSNTTLSLTADETTYYFFVPDTQMRFVLQIVKYAYGKIASV